MNPQSTQIIRLLAPLADARPLQSFRCARKRPEHRVTSSAWLAIAVDGSHPWFDSHQLHWDARSARTTLASINLCIADEIVGRYRYDGPPAICE
jgi:hypothetical protein